MLIAQLLAGTLLALSASAAYGASSVLQFRASKRTPEEPAGRPALLLRLIRQRGWRWSVVLAAMAFGLQIAALSLIPLVLVQPLLVTGLLWYVLLYVLVERVRLDIPIVLESLLCLLGLSAFLLIAQPSAGHGRNLDSVWAALLLAAAVVGSLALCLTTAVKLSRSWRPLPLALAAGICYGVTAGLVSSLAFHFHGNPVGVLGQWQTYAIAVLGPFGVLLSQNAYQAGPMGAPALAVITVVDPLVSIGVGLLWLGEEIRTGPPALLGEALALAVLAGAVFLLARRAPNVDPESPARR